MTNCVAANALHLVARRWPSFTLQFLLWMRVFTLDLPILPFVGCVNRSSFVNAFFITVLFPPALIGLMILLLKLRLQTHYEVWRNSIYVLFLCYPRTCETVVNAFRCYTLKDGRRFLLEDFNIECDSNYIILMWPTALAGLVVYGFGVPIGFYWRLHMHRDVLSAPAPHYCMGFL